MKKGKNNDNNLEANDDIPKIDIKQHLHKNIIHPKYNCKENLSEDIYYCITCKLSTCGKCSLNHHKNHKIFKKLNFYSYPPNFFDEVDNLISQSYELAKEKNIYINIIEQQSKELHNKIDEIKLKKKTEICEIFKKGVEYINT